MHNLEYNFLKDFPWPGQILLLIKICSSLYKLKNILRILFCIQYMAAFLNFLKGLHISCIFDLWGLNYHVPSIPVIEISTRHIILRKFLLEIQSDVERLYGIAVENHCRQSVLECLPLQISAHFWIF